MIYPTIGVWKRIYTITEIRVLPWEDESLWGPQPTTVKKKKKKNVDSKRKG